MEVEEEISKANKNPIYLDYKIASLFGVRFRICTIELTLTGSNKSLMARQVRKY